MEIERKFLLNSVPELAGYEVKEIEQAYLCRRPVMRIRRSNDKYIFTYKGGGMMAREEANLPLTKEAFDELLSKTEGPIIKKKRYMIPYGTYTIELDYFESPNPGLFMAEVEFPTVEEAILFEKPDWFGEEVTDNPAYHNSNMK